ncbi:MAG: superoxide dismutase family protein [Flavobacteriaceae bacterium]|nr:superoxide dismutase family protein [Flavobacteriaceae bacterium]
MSAIRSILVTIVLLTLVGCSSSNDSSARAILLAKSGSEITGEVLFKERNGRVTMTAKVENVSSGNHAIHIHAIGDCSTPDGKSAGGHWNPTNENHGKWGEQPFHRGDIGNMVVGDDGKGIFERTTDLWCIECEDEVKDIVGKAIIVHAGPDDFSSQPAGAAGARIGCGEIVKQ